MRVGTDYVKAFSGQCDSSGTRFALVSELNEGAVGLTGEPCPGCLWHERQWGGMTGVPFNRSFFIVPFIGENGS